MESWTRRVSRFRRLTWKMKLLFIVAYFLMGIVRLGILIVPFKYIAPLLGMKNRSTAVDVDRGVLVQAAKVGFAVETMSRFTPWESKCLVKAITAQLLLRIWRTPSTLYLGVSKDASKMLIAHAWLKCGTLILTGERESIQFKSVAHFGSLIGKEMREVER